MPEETSNIWNKKTDKLNLLKKIQQIQSSIKELVKTEKNEYQNYFFFNEVGVMKLLKGLLAQHQLAILISDDTSQPFIHEISNNGKLHYVKYLKRVEIVDTAQENSSLSFSFWACAEHSDLAKAKGASDTYITKYSLSKLFLMEVTDNNDPDYSGDSKAENKKEKEKVDKLFSSKEGSGW